MKLVHIIHSVDPAGGGPIEGLKQLAGPMAEMGHETEVVSLDNPVARWVREFPLPIHALGQGGKGYGFSRRLVPWLRQNAAGYDAIIIRGIWQYHSFGCWRALRKSGTPYVVFTHGMLDPWFKRAYPLKHVKKWMYWPWAEYRVLRDARVVLFTSEEERRLARESFWLYRSREAVVNYGTAMPAGDSERQRDVFFARYPQLRDKRIILFLGRIHAKKGCDLLIKAFAKVIGRDAVWHLVFAGPDQVGWQAELTALAREAGVSESITWTGMLSGDIKYGALKAAEVFALPSHQENFGIVVAESLACGTPVLISNKVNIWREVYGDGAGLVDDDDLTGTCSLLESWLSLSVERKKRMSELALNCFRRRFDVRESAASLIRILSNLVRQPSPEAFQLDATQ
jgi:glycosyltransferase involved in cell wall biosynthesis